MSSNDSTPASVLEAPERTVVWISDQPHPNRFARRKVRTSTGGLVHIPKAYQQPARNEPYRAV